MKSTGHMFKDIIADACPEATAREREFIFHESQRFFIYGREVTTTKAQTVWRKMLREKVSGDSRVPVTTYPRR